MIFPHHENEIAQSRCAHGTPLMARYWLHNGFLQVEGEKMSKSLGNFVTIRELLSDWPGEVVRLAMLMTHYREPINWTRQQLEQADLELQSWLGNNELAVEAQAEVAERRVPGRAGTSLPNEFVQALEDDLNTPLAVTVLRQFTRKGAPTALELRQIFLMAEFLGLVRVEKIGVHTRPVYGGALARHDIGLTLKLRAAVANGFISQANSIQKSLTDAGLEVQIAADGWISVKAVDTKETNKAEALVAARAAARKAKNFAEADRIRAELDAMGIALKDSKDPATGELVTTWEVKR